MLANSDVLFYIEIWPNMLPSFRCLSSSSIMERWNKLFFRFPTFVRLASWNTAKRHSRISGEKWMDGSIPHIWESMIRKCLAFLLGQGCSQHWLYAISHCYDTNAADSWYSWVVQALEMLNITLRLVLSPFFQEMSVFLLFTVLFLLFSDWPLHSVWPFMHNCRG